MAQAPPNYSWVVEGKIAACGCPTEPTHFDYLKKSGINRVVALTKSYPEGVEPNFGRVDMQLSRVAMPDFHPPTEEQIAEFVKLLEDCQMQNEPVAVHCKMGKGRTGTMLACYLVKNENLSHEEAIKKIRDMRPGSIETEEQEKAIENYYRRLTKWGDPLSLPDRKGNAPQKTTVTILWNRVLFSVNKEKNLQILLILLVINHYAL